MTFLGMSLITLMGKVKDLKTGMRNSQKDVIKKKKNTSWYSGMQGRISYHFLVKSGFLFQSYDKFSQSGGGTEVILSGVSGMEILSHFPHPTK